MMLKATDIRRGMVITIEGVNFVVLDFAHHTPGNLRAMVQTKLRNMNNGSLIEKRLRSVDQIEVPYVETKEYEYLYSAGDDHVFMDTETYDQLSFSPEIIGTAMDYLLPNSQGDGQVHQRQAGVDRSPRLCRADGDRHASGPGGRDRHQPVQGSHARDPAQGPGSAVHQAGRENPDRHPDRRIPRTGQVSSRPWLGSRPVDDLTRLLSALVAIPSVNPMGRSLAGPEYFETRLTDYLEAWFRELGVRCERQPVAPGRDNLLAWYDGPEPAGVDPLRCPSRYRAG